MFHTHNISVKDIQATSAVAFGVLSGGTEIQGKSRSPIMGVGFLFAPKFIKVLWFSISQSEVIKKNLCESRTFHRTISHKENIKSAGNDLAVSTGDLQDCFTV